MFFKEIIPAEIARELTAEMKKRIEKKTIKRLQRKIDGDIRRRAYLGRDWIIFSFNSSSEMVIFEKNIKSELEEKGYSCGMLKPALMYPDGAVRIDW